MRLFFELLQVALGHHSSLSIPPTEEGWKAIFDIAQKQTVAGVVFEALDTLSNKGIKPPQALLFEWIGLYEQVKNQNRVVNQRCIEITKTFSNAGWKTCILKGQGNARLYPNPLSRQAGDIDIWVRGKENDIKRFVRDRFPEAEDCLYHIDYPIFNDVEVEVHYAPSYIRAPKYGYDRKIKEFYEKHAEEQFAHKVYVDGVGGEMCVPTDEFNIVYQLMHIKSHFINYGVGLRQIIDYYYLLSNIEDKNSKVRWKDQLEELGLLKIAGAVMWVLHNTMGLAPKYLIVEPDEARGKLLLSEIFACGNMGKYDNRISGIIRGNHPYASKAMRGLRIGAYFPYDVWVEPLLGKIYKMNH